MWDDALAKRSRAQMAFPAPCVNCAVVQLSSLAMFSCGNAASFGGVGALAFAVPLFESLLPGLYEFRRGLCSALSEQFEFLAVQSVVRHKELLDFLNQMLYSRFVRRSERHAQLHDNSFLYIEQGDGLCQETMSDMNHRGCRR